MPMIDERERPGRMGGREAPTEAAPILSRTEDAVQDERQEPRLRAWCGDEHMRRDVGHGDTMRGPMPSDKGEQNHGVP